MGAKTIAHVSGATYKIDMSPEEAKEYDDIWTEIFAPEAQLLKLVNSDMIDHVFTSRSKKKFTYTTPMGMVRPNCSYAACANGSILQSPSAEGATLACINVGKAAHCDTYYRQSDKSSKRKLELVNNNSILRNNFKPFAFVHDEILGNVIACPETATAVAKELEKVMVDSLMEICPDITPSADSALMIEWSKKAFDVYNKEGYLVPWEVTKDEKLAKELNYAL
jgi:hypothetical protein